MRLLVLLSYTVVSIVAHFVFAGEFDKSSTIDYKDFGYGTAIYLHGMSRVYQLSIPYHVYQKITKPNLGDIRVFNSNHHTVSSAITRPVITTKTDSQELPFFPVYATSSDINAIKLNAKYNNAGVLIDVRARSPSSTSKERLRGYLLDMRVIQNVSLQKIQVHWKTKSKNWLTPLALSVSDDLLSWRVLPIPATIADLQYNDDKIIRDTIKLPRVTSKYMMIQWRNKARDIRFDKIVAAIERKSSPPPPIIWHTYQAVTIKGQEPGSFVFHVKASMPVTRLDFKLPFKNVSAKAFIYYRNKTSETWHYAKNATIYNVFRDGENISSPPIETNAIRARYWKITFQPSDQISQNDFMLRLGWWPEQLLFMANEAPPFRLAYGSSRVNKDNENQIALLQKIKNNKDFQKIGTATVGPEYVISGEAALNTMNPADIKSIILWIVIVIGVLAVALVVISVIKMLQQNEDFNIE